MNSLPLILTLGGLVLSAGLAQAQSETADVGEGNAAPLPLARTGLYAELLGSGVGLSLHIDRLVSSTSEGHVSVHAGAGLVPLVGYTVPVGASYLRGRGSRLLEAGLSVVLLFSEDGESAVVPMGLAGYRYQPRRRGDSSASASALPCLRRGCSPCPASASAWQANERCGGQVSPTCWAQIRPLTD